MKEEIQRNPVPEQPGLNIIPVTPERPDRMPRYVPDVNDIPLDKIQDESDKEIRDEKKREDIADDIIKKRRGRYVPAKMPDPKARH